MASGKTHNTVNTILLVPLLAAGHWWGEQALSLVAFGSAYLVGTFLLSPDLDLADGARVNSKRNWGRLGGLWAPYGRAFSHRGLSHTYLLGPLTRLLYLLLLLALFAGLLFFIWPQGLSQLWQAVPAGGNLLLPLLLGYYLSQWLHLMLDGIWPWHEGRILRRELAKGRRRRRR